MVTLYPTVDIDEDTVEGNHVVALSTWVRVKNHLVKTSIMYLNLPYEKCAPLFKTECEDVLRNYKIPTGIVYNELIEAGKLIKL